MNKPVIFRHAELVSGSNEFEINKTLQHVQGDELTGTVMLNSFQHLL
ncbi:MAG: hypothetical protein WB492_06815 [Christiangramia sp.]